MKKIRLFILMAAILLAPKGFCKEDCCFEFAGEWLYMLSAIDQPYYAVNIGTGADLFNGDRVANDQEWHSGYRLEAAYNFCCCNTARVRWTHLNNFSDSSRDENLSDGILIHPESPALNISSSEIRDRFDFYYLDVLYERMLYDYCPFSLGLFAGVQFAHLDMNEDVSYQGTTASIRIENQSKLRGIGPELGLNLNYALFNCLDIKGRASSTMLISEKSAKSREFDPTLLYATENEDYWIGTPVFNVRFGLSYDYALSCACLCGNLNLEVGYEIIHILKGVDRIYFVDSTNLASSITQNMDFTLHGPYVHLGFCF